MKKSKAKIIWVPVLIVLLVFASLMALHCNQHKSTTPKQPDTPPSNPILISTPTPLGTWWWNKNLDADDYLDYATANGVTEIYFCDYACGAATANIVEKAAAKNIAVYLLAGEKEWLSDRSGLDDVIANFQTFQATHDTKLAGIHLDIEPHQFSDFKTNRATYLLKLVTLINANKTTYPALKFDYDIPFWLNDEITYDGTTKPTYQHIIDAADRTFLMSYRDTAAAMYDVSQEEITYAVAHDKIVYLGAETYSEEGDQVSYLEEGNTYLIEQLTELRAALPANFGIAIHHIKTWRNLPD